MSYVLDNAQTADVYKPLATLMCLGSAQLNIDVFNQGIYYELGETHGNAGVLWSGVQVPVPPGFRSLTRSFDAVRFRSRTPGKPARVNAEALTGGDLV